MAGFLDFHGHFILDNDPTVKPEGWLQKQISGFTLAWHPASEFIPVVVNQTEVGFILGFVLDPDNILENRVLKLNNPDISEYEEKLFSLAGRYVSCIHLNSQKRFYLDASGGMPAVYSSVQQQIASVPSLFFANNPAQNLDPALFDRLGMPKRHLWYPAGLTPFKNIQRLLPNHFLNLDSWETHRHWPVAGKSGSREVGNDLTDEFIKQIGKTIQKILASATAQNTLWLSLTAGRDSRMLLACAKPYLDKIKFFTFTEDQESVDRFVSNQIAAELKLNWSPLQIEQAAKAEKKAWLEKTGFAVTDTIMDIHVTLKKLDRSGIIAPGMAGEVGRAFYWKNSDTENTPLDAQELLKRIKLPAHPAFIQATDRWLKTVNQFNFFTQLDLAYIELRLGCWGMPQTYGHLHLGEHFYPFSHRKIFGAMLALPPKFRQNQKLYEQICNTFWPELLNFPVNKFTGFKKILGIIQKAQRVVPYLRNRFGF